MPKQFIEHEDLPIKPCEDCWVDADECFQCPLLDQDEYTWQVEALDGRYVPVSNLIQLEGG